MANIVITSTTNSIKVDFGDYASSYGYAKGTWRKDNVGDIRLAADSSYISIHTMEDQRWTISYNASGQAMIIDSVDTAAPTSNSDLYDKLIALIA